MMSSKQKKMATFILVLFFAIFTIYMTMNFMHSFQTAFNSPAVSASHP